jgi:hypothetical protein
MLKPVQSRHYGFVLLVQVFLFFMAPFMRGHPFLFVLFLVGLFGIFGSVILTVWTAKLPRLLTIACAIVAVVTGFLAFPSMNYEQPVLPYLLVCCAAYALFILIAIITIGADVLARERITLDCILGSICVYLFLGMFFAFDFGLCALLLPGAFHSPWGGGSPGTIALNDILYFSYSTLTTVGYGDITPAHPFVRALASFEAVTGTLYIAVMIARLVGLHVVHGGQARS